MRSIKLEKTGQKPTKAYALFQNIYDDYGFWVTSRCDPVDVDEVVEVEEVKKVWKTI